MSASRLAARPMTDAEYGAYVENLIRTYADEKVQAGEWSPDAALEKSRAGIAKMLPEGLRTPGNLLLILTETARGSRVGHLWIDVGGKPDPAVGFIYDIEIDPGHRGAGLGRQALALAEAEVRRHGRTEMRLFVFGFNTAAIGLYRACGYEVVNMMMRKALGAA